VQRKLTFPQAVNKMNAAQQYSRGACVNAVW